MSILKHQLPLFCILFLLLFSCASEQKKVPVVASDFCSDIHRNDTVSLSSELSSLSKLMEDKTGVYVLEDGGGALMIRGWLSEYAEQTIDIQYFIFSTDNVGLIACDYLVRAADRGVKVRLLVDDILVDAKIEDILTLDAHENIDIRIYNPGVNLGKNIFGKIKEFATDFRSANQRMHNKTFIVDGEVVITGGRNIADEYFDFDHDYNFRDRDVLLLGKTSRTVQTSFNEFWNHPLAVNIKEITDKDIRNVNNENRYDALHEYACNPENFWPQIREKISDFPIIFHQIQASGALVWVDSVAFVSDVPGKNDNTKRLGLSGGGLSTDALIELVKNAKESIDIQSPYLITSKLSQDLFREATERGVKIRILTNSLASTDNLEAFNGYQRSRKKLLKTGVQIYEWKPDAAIRYKIMAGDLQSKLDFTPVFGFHAKSMVVDGKIAVVGTFNLDPRSANLNTECMAVIYSEQVAADMMKEIEEEFKAENAWQTTLEYNPDKEVGVKKRLKSWTRKVVPKAVL